MTNTRFAKRTAVAALAAALLPGVSGAAENLGDITKDIRIDPLGITVSGVSSGAYMAVQFQVAYSSMVKGVGVIAGGPDLCARHTKPRLTSKLPLEGIDGPNAGFICSQAWVGSWYADQHYLAGATAGIVGSPDIRGSISETKQLYRQRKIDNPANIRSAKVWLFSGGQDVTDVTTPSDTLVPPYIVASVGRFYTHFGADVKMPDQSHSAAHSMVVDNKAKQCPDVTKPAPPPYTCVNACGILGGSYINNCDYDAAG